MFLTYAPVVAVLRAEDVAVADTVAPAKMHLQAFVTPRASLMAENGDELCGMLPIQVWQKEVAEEPSLASITAMLLCTLAAAQVELAAYEERMQSQAVLTPLGNAMLEKPDDACGFAAFQFSQKIIGDGLAALMTEMLLATLVALHVLATLLTLEGASVVDALVEVSDSTEEALLSGAAVCAAVGR